jgi:lipopolysaccharide biosynthesis glycosyltransferase
VSVIKICVSSDKQSYVPEHPLLFPIQTGVVLQNAYNANELHNKKGENISAHFTLLGELAAQYWAWKNIDADYYGLMQANKYFSFSATTYPVDSQGYISLGLIDNDALNMLGFDEKSMRNIIENNDIITNIPVHFDRLYRLPPKERNVLGQYARDSHNIRNDLELAFTLIRETYPDFAQDVTRYANDKTACLGNTYIMSKEFMFGYNEWLFAVLEKLETAYIALYTADHVVRSINSIAERLFGIYLAHLLRTKPKMRVKFLQICLFNSTVCPYPAPITKERNIAIAMCLSEEYAVFGAVLMHSIMEHANLQDYYDFIILENGIPPVSQKQLSDSLVHYPNVSIRYVGITSVLAAYHLPYILHLSSATYGRFLTIEYLKNYSKVLYLDSDIVLADDVAVLFRTELGGAYVGAVRDTGSAGWCCMANRKTLKYLQDTLQLKNPFDYFNGGVLLMNIDSLRADHSAKELLLMAERGKWQWMDQDVLNYVCNGKVFFLPQEWNVIAHAGSQVKNPPENYLPGWLKSEYLLAKEHPRLIHWAGHSTPCFHTDSEFSDYFWNIARRSSYYEQLLGKMVNDQIRRYIHSADLTRQRAILHQIHKMRTNIRHADIKKHIRILIDRCFSQSSACRRWLEKCFMFYKRHKRI